MAMPTEIVSVNGNSSVANDAYLTIQPGAGVEWVIHNLFLGDTGNIETYDGSNAIVFETGAAGWVGNLELHCTNTDYIRIQNKSGDSARFGYDGIISRNADA